MAEEPADLPSQSQVEDALTHLLRSQDGGGIRPAEAYKALADVFQLTDEQRHKVMTKSARRHWENRVQWARQKLVNSGVMAAGPQGRWSLASADRVGKDWSEEEAAALVADYFAMLREEVAGRPYSKTEHRNRLMTLVQRSPGSIERKHQNVSAVLQEHGYPWITGYKPFGNYQKSVLPRLILPYLLKDGQILDRVVGKLAAPLAVSETFVEPPLEGVVLSEPSDPIARKFDIAKRDARNRELGAAGEGFVVRVERQRLLDAGRVDLADKVDNVSVSKGDGLGYDIISFELDGSAIFIEVKTTRGGPCAPFFLSETERRVASNLGHPYRLYRVFNFGFDPQIFVLNGPLDGRLDLRPTAYRAGLLPKSK